MSKQILVSTVAKGDYDVEVHDGSQVTKHHVHVTDPSNDDTARVKKSFEFLLEREPATSILQTFNLDVIANYFPEYPEEMKKRLKD